MKNLFAVILSLFFINAFGQNAPDTKKIPVSYSKHGVTITDNYSWLEKLDAPETKKWVEEENKMTAAHFQEIRKKYNLEKKIREYDSHESSSLPKKKEKYFYSVYYTERDKSPSLFYQKTLDQ